MISSHLHVFGQHLSPSAHIKSPLAQSFGEDVVVVVDGVVFSVVPKIAFKDVTFLYKNITNYNECLDTDMIYSILFKIIR